MRGSRSRSTAWTAGTKHSEGTDPLCRPVRMSRAARGCLAALGLPPYRCVLISGSGPIQGASAARGERAKAAEPAPSSFCTGRHHPTLLLCLPHPPYFPRPAPERCSPTGPCSEGQWAPLAGDRIGTFTRPQQQERGEGTTISSAASTGTTALPLGFRGSCLLGHGGEVLFKRWGRARVLHSSLRSAPAGR